MMPPLFRPIGAREWLRWYLTPDVCVCVACALACVAVWVFA